MCAMWARACVSLCLGVRVLVYVRVSVCVSLCMCALALLVSSLLRMFVYPLKLRCLGQLFKVFKCLQCACQS